MHHIAQNVTRHVTSHTSHVTRHMLTLPLGVLATAMGDLAGETMTGEGVSLQIKLLKTPLEMQLQHPPVFVLLLLLLLLLSNQRSEGALHNRALTLLLLLLLLTGNEIHIQSQRSIDLHKRHA